MCNFGRRYQEEGFNEFISNGPVVQEMSFKRCLIWNSGGPPFQLSQTIYAILKEGRMGNIHVKLHAIWTSRSGGGVVERYSNLELWRLICSVEQKYLCKFGSSYQEELCENIFNLDQWFRRCLLKKFIIWISSGPFVQRRRTICAILVEGIMRNISVNSFRNWASGSGDVA